MKNITFINAGAGSGKTYNLTEELYKNINLGFCHGNQVLLTTFTKKAAKEIKLRAHTKLLEKGKVEEAVLLQNAYIGAIHSVGYHLIKKFCYLIGISPNIKELSAEDTDFYFSQAISSIPTVNDLDNLAKLSERFQFQKMNGVVKAFDPNKWKDHVNTIINEARRNKIDDLSETGMSFQQSIRFVQDVFQFNADTAPSLDWTQLTPLFHQMILFLENLPDKGNKGRKDGGQNLKSSLKTNKISYATLINISEIAGDIIQKKEPSNPAATELLRVLEHFYRSNTFFEDIQKYNSLVFKIARDCIDAFDSYKKEHALVDYTDMETNFLLLLDMPEVRAELKESVKVVMVDEFQDSNPIQLSIFLKLASIVDKSIWVGDPKQAIYGFNGSDPVLVSKLLAAFYQSDEPSLNIRLLKNSWRSRPDIVNLTNRIFEQSLEDQSTSFTVHKDDVLGDENALEQWINEKISANDQIKLSARDTIGLLPVRQDIIEGFPPELQHAALRHWHLTDNEKKIGNEAEFNAYLAKRVLGLLSEGLSVYDLSMPGKRPLLPSDVAILCKKNSEVKSIAAALIDQGIEVAATVDGLSLTAEYRLLINILNYFADSGNSLAITEILLLIKKEENITGESLLEERLAFISQMPEPDNENPSEPYEYLSTWGKDHPFIHKLDAFIQKSKHLSVPELVEKATAELELTRHIAAWGHADQRTSNIQQLISYAYNYDDYCVKLGIASSLIGFVQWQQANDDRNNQAASSNLNAVNVLTYHKAKGLEWPFVILSSLRHNYNYKALERDFFRTSVKTMGELDIENPLNNRYINFCFWPLGTKEKILGYEETIKESLAFKEVEKTKIHETKRLLYVGVTRARDYLTTTSFKAKKTPWIDLVNNQNEGWSLQGITQLHPASGPVDLFGHHLPVNYQVMTYDVNEKENELMTPAYKAGYYFPKAEARTQNTPKYLSPSHLKSQSAVQVKLTHDFAHRIKIADVDNASLGNYLHDVFYLLPHLPDEAKIGSIMERHHLTGLIDIKNIATAMAQFKDYIDLQKPLNTYRELSLSMAKDGHMYMGSADLVLEFDDHLTLIDYKTYPGTLQNILDPQGAHYVGNHAGQLDAYAEILETSTGKKVTQKLIYYPVMGKVIELI